MNKDLHEEFKKYVVMDAEQKHLEVTKKMFENIKKVSTPKKYKFTGYVESDTGDLISISLDGSGQRDSEHVRYIYVRDFSDIQKMQMKGRSLVTVLLEFYNGKPSFETYRIYEDDFLEERIIDIKSIEIV